MGLKGTINNISAPHIHAGSDITSGEIDSAYLEHQPQSMARQAIINGNFDIWQRGTSLASVTDATNTFLADRWYLITSPGGGTNPTIAQSRQALTPGEIDKSFYFYRISPNGAGTSLGASSYARLNQKIEHGMRYLCGDGKTITLKFKARSSIANKKIGASIITDYGTGGSPSSGGNISGTHWDLTSSWQDCEFTFTMPSNSGKTFGTDNNDFLRIIIYFVWGDSFKSLVGDTVAETWVGSGDIDIAQVQVCSGDVALPFEPKTYNEELMASLRYALVLDSSLNQYTTFGFAIAWNADTSQYIISLNVPMRTTPTLTYSAAGDFKVFREGGIYSNISSITIDTMTKTSLQGSIYWNASSGYTSGAGNFQADATNSAWMLFSAEL